MTKNPRRYSFEQIIRLLRLWARPESGAAWEAMLRTRLRFRPSLSLGFAATDVDALELTLPEEKSPDGCPFTSARVTASFLGLYGPSSPLPTFYTERLLDEEGEDFTVTRDFLDIFNNGFFLLYCKLVSRINPLRKTLEEADPGAAHMLMALAGFGTPELRAMLHDEFACLRYAGLFSQFPRSALGLRTLLADASGGVRVRVVQHVPRNMPVPDDQKARLGVSSCTLGEDLVLGSSILCYEGKIRIEITDLDADAMYSLLPGTPKSLLLHDLIGNYCTVPFEYEVALCMRPGAVEALQPGGNAARRFARLGYDAWLGGGIGHDHASFPTTAFFPGGYQ